LQETDKGDNVVAALSISALGLLGRDPGLFFRAVLRGSRLNFLPLRHQKIAKTFRIYISDAAFETAPRHCPALETVFSDPKVDHAA